MKVGILTVNGFNYGSFLQAFALKKLVEELGHEVYIINTMALKYTILNLLGDLSTLQVKKFFALLNAWKNLKLSSFKHFDIIIIGSDVVWNNSKPDKFFGYKLSANKIATYAPCCSGTTYNDLNSLRIKSMNKIDYFSARDRETAELIKTVTNKKAINVLDPTFLIDWSKYEVPTDLNNFILVYSYSGKNRDMAIMAKELAQRENKKLVSVINNISWCDTYISGISPFEFLGLMKKADYVITDTFHGTAFSLIYKKHFASFPNSHKVEYLLDSLEIPYDILTKYNRKNVIEEKKQISKKYLSSIFKNIRSIR